MKFNKLLPASIIVLSILSYVVVGWMVLRILLGDFHG